MHCKYDKTPLVLKPFHPSIILHISHMKSWQPPLSTRNSFASSANPICRHYFPLPPSPQADSINQTSTATIRSHDAKRLPSLPCSECIHSRCSQLPVRCKSSLSKSPCKRILSPTGSLPEDRRVYASPQSSRPCIVDVCVCDCV